MDLNITAFLFSVGAVTLAEMGDKTQLLAMAFAAKYKASKVMLGVFLATVLNHGLAVALGNFITRYQALDVWIKAIAALSFIFFGLWTIRGDKLDGEETKKSKYGAVMTVSIAFFIAELGDKTQLATIAIAANFPTSPIGILLGTTVGMLIADGIGIIFGVVMCKRIPERTVKLISAGAFVFFGFLGIYQVMAGKLNFDAQTIIGVMVIIAIITAASAYYLIKNNKEESNAAEEYCRLRKREARDQ